MQSSLSLLSTHTHVHRCCVSACMHTDNAVYMLRNTQMLAGTQTRHTHTHTHTHGARGEFMSSSRFATWVVTPSTGSSLLTVSPVAALSHSGIHTHTHTHTPTHYSSTHAHTHTHCCEFQPYLTAKKCAPLQYHSQLNFIIVPLFHFHGLAAKLIMYLFITRTLNIPLLRGIAEFK